MSDGNGWFGCWCYTTKRQVNIKGKLTLGSIAQILTVEKCSKEAVCPQVFSSACLLGKRREGKFVEKKKIKLSR